MNRPYFIQNPKGRFTLGITVREDGSVVVASAFCKSPDIYSRRKGFHIVKGRLDCDSKDCLILKRKLKNAAEIDIFKSILIPVLDTVNSLKFKSGRRSAESVLRKVVRTLDKIISVENSLTAMLEVR